jgi:methyltransferase (TIGR00027 family)
MVRGQPSQTAEAVCWMRATERRRKPAERIVDDPYAKLFLGPMLRAALATWEVSGRIGELADRFSPGLITWVLCRHRYIDDRLVAALGGRVEQVVVLGAGYDMRAYRFATELAYRPVFEVDYPATSQRKARLLGRHKAELPKSDVRVVEIDFERDSLRDRLREAGFQRGVRTFFIWEGVAMYLTRDAVKKTLTELRELSAAGSEIAMDLWYVPEGADILSTAHRLSASALSLIGEPVTFAIHPEDAGAFLNRLCYRVREIADAGMLESRYVHDRRRVYRAAYMAHACTRPARRAAKASEVKTEEAVR